MLTVLMIAGESATKPVELIDDEDDIAVDAGAAAVEVASTSAFKCR